MTFTIDRSAFLAILWLFDFGLTVLVGRFIYWPLINWLDRWGQRLKHPEEDDAPERP